jgi:hypothetical protein
MACNERRQTDYPKYSNMDTPLNMQTPQRKPQTLRNLLRRPRSPATGTPSWSAALSQSILGKNVYAILKGAKSFMVLMT